MLPASPIVILVTLLAGACAPKADVRGVQTASAKTPVEAPLPPTVEIPLDESPRPPRLGAGAGTANAAEANAAASAPMMLSLTQAAESSSAVFIATIHQQPGTACAAMPTAEDGPKAAPHLADATVFLDRYNVIFQVVEIVRDPLPGTNAPTTLTGEREPLQSTVAFPLGPTAFEGRLSETREEYGEFGEAYCHQLEAMLSQPFMVIFAYGVYVDHGISGRGSLYNAWNDLGTDPRRPNKGFASLAAAQAFVAELKSSD